MAPAAEYKLRRFALTPLKRRHPSDVGGVLSVFLQHNVKVSLPDILSVDH